MTPTRYETIKHRLDTVFARAQDAELSNDLAGRFARGLRRLANAVTFWTPADVPQPRGEITELDPLPIGSSGRFELVGQLEPQQLDYCLRVDTRCRVCHWYSVLIETDLDRLEPDRPGQTTAEAALMIDEALETHRLLCRCSSDGENP